MTDKKKGKKEEQNTSLLTRRDLLKIGGATAGAAIVTQLVTTGPLSAGAVQGIGASSHPEEGSSEHQWHMIIDLSKCIGCY
jgi:hypothetical protein